MKKIILLSFALAALLLSQFTTSKAQVCVVDPLNAAPGIYPSDTLPDMIVDTATQEIVQFVFPSDTVLFGFTLPFDSFVVSQVSQLPPGLTWQCNQNHPYCAYVTTPGILTRGCVKISGTPTATNPAYPLYDSIIVTGVAWVTLPFGGPTPIAQDIPVYYRIGTGVGIASPFAKTGLSIAPNPAVGSATVRYKLGSGAVVRLSVVDLLGREVAVLHEGMQRVGEQEFVIDCKDLPTGTYLLKLALNQGEVVQTKKFASVR